MRISHGKLPYQLHAFCTPCPWSLWILVHIRCWYLVQMNIQYNSGHILRPLDCRSICLRRWLSPNGQVWGNRPECLRETRFENVQENNDRFYLYFFGAEHRLCPAQMGKIATWKNRHRFLTQKCTGYVPLWNFFRSFSKFRSLKIQLKVEKRIWQEFCLKFVWCLAWIYKEI